MKIGEYEIRKLEGNAAERTVNVTAFHEVNGTITMTIPTAGMDADALPAAIEAAFGVKVEAEDAANAD